MSEAIAAVVFDLDGVLVDSESVWDAARNFPSGNSSCRILMNRSPYRGSLIETVMVTRSASLPPTRLSVRSMRVKQARA